MASSINLDVDAATDSKVDLREGSITDNTNHVKRPSAESSKSDMLSSNTQKKKKKKNKSIKSISAKRSSATKTSGKTRIKTPKKVSIMDEKLSSNDGSDTGSSTETSSDSEPIAKTNPPSKKGKSKKSARAHRKPGKSTRSHPQSDESDAETIDTTDADDTRDDGAQKELALVKQQLQLLTRQIAGLGGSGLGGIGLAKGYQFNTGGLSTGVPGGNLSGYNGDQSLGIARVANGSTPSRSLGGRRPPPPGGRRYVGGGDDSCNEEDDEDGYLHGHERGSDIKGRIPGKRQQRLEFRRVDQVWDSNIHNFKLQDTAESGHNSRYDEYLFNVRRTFDWEGKYKATVVDIKSKQLREALSDVMGNIKGISLVEETPKLDPNMLFLYLEDLREHMANLKDLEPEGKTKKERKKVQKWIDQKRRHLRVLMQYLDKDYALVKKSLYPLLENGLITFDLLWALWKPNTLTYTTTYGSVDEPRIFKIEMAEKQRSILKGEFFYVEGKYFEYDGKQFGYGSMADEIPEFRGARKISSLSSYPLKYHKNEAQVHKDLIARGKKFVSLAGSHYKSHHGIAYYKKKKSVVKVNINGRVMIDPSTHRRNNPNYPISLVRPEDHDLLSEAEDSDDEGCCGSNSDEAGDGGKSLIDDEDRVKYVTKVIQDKDGNTQQIRIAKDELDGADHAKRDGLSVQDDSDDGDGKEDQDNKEDLSSREFSDEEYLIASPVVLGFAFAEKLWVELSVSGVKEISWNESAYSSLVLEPKTKDIVKALVESHKYHAAESIDDVIQGKGKGLVFVLHGPPGTGKTLTAEGISELLKCPLYNVSAGDLGTDSRLLEGELQRILDICHAWGAILLLDEADVFLEKRNMHDIHRNALVSIFLRHLEYFQGILFLTTNRVETFDDAFQSRIHIALRYDVLDAKAKKAIFKIFIERVRALQETPITDFTDEEYNLLARHNLNGRQIKNTIRTAQALAVNRGEALGMKHIVQFLDVLQSFERDLKGGTGYQDAMRSYF